MSLPLPVALVVDDEAHVRRVIRDALANDFSRVLESGTGKEAIDLVAAQRPALVILDLGLPDMSGVEVCHRLRGYTSAPIVVLSPRHTRTEKDALFEVGADEYVAKPFTPAELQSKVRAAMESREGAPIQRPQQVTYGTLTIDFESESVTVDGAPVHLTPTEWGLLKALTSKPGKALTHHDLFTEVWSGRQYGDAQQYLRVHIANLRRKIQDDAAQPYLIVTEPGVGYRFTPP